MHLEKSTATLIAVPTSKETAEPSAGVFTRRNLCIAALLAVGALGFFLILDKIWLIPVNRASSGNYFALQADAWLHGRWDIDSPANHLDLVSLRGKSYSIYGPFPALLMLPLVVIFGPGVSDVLFTMAVSAVNLGLLFLLLEQLRANGLTHRGWRENAVWSVLLYIGSTALLLSLGGSVWFTGHIVACACLLVSLLLAFRRRFVWAAVALGGAFFSRPTLLLGFPLLLYLAWQDGGETHPVQLVAPFARSLWTRRPIWSAVPWRRLGGVLAVLAACLALYLLRNWAVFGDPLQNGYNLQLAQDYPHIVKHGVNSPSYIASNLINDFFNFPHIHYQINYTNSPLIDLVNDKTGTAVFLTTPLFLFLLFWRNARRSWLRIALWANILLLMAFVLTFYTAGYPQFGTRYLFDIYPYAWVVLAIGELRTDWRFVALGMFAVIINILGSCQFWVGFDGYYLPHFLVR